VFRAREGASPGQSRGLEKSAADADRRSRIVFITRGIDRVDLEASFLEQVVASGALTCSQLTR
jgi:hypothetical protein